MSIEVDQSITPVNSQFSQLSEFNQAIRSVNRLNHLLFGLRPLGFHLVNLLLHSCVCLLLTRLLLRLLRLPQGTVLSAGLIFATHPVHTEAVTGLVGRADVLASISFLAALLTYHRAIEGEAEDSSDAEMTDDEGGGGGGGGGWEGRREVPVFVEGGVGGGSGAGVGGYLCDTSRRGIPAGMAQDALGGRGRGEGRRRRRRRWYRRRRKRQRLLTKQPPDTKCLRSFPETLLSTDVLIPALVQRLAAVVSMELSHDWQMGSIPSFLTSLGDPRNTASLLLYTSLALILRAGCLSKGREGRAVLLGLSLLVLPFLPAQTSSSPAGLRDAAHNAKMQYNFANLQKDLATPTSPGPLEAI
ncbi:O-mannosyl-transferase TMTC1-like 2, partial [Homarus americanus]